MRFLDGRGADLIPRQDGVWSAGGLSARMVTALRDAGRDVPAWLELVASELAVDAPGRAVFAMHCFWEGEAALGALDGVVATRPGFVGGEEVVEVAFDPARASFETLVRAAQSLQCASTIHCTDDEQLAVARRIAGERARKLEGSTRAAPASDRKRALRASPLWRVPMTPAQQSRVNADLARKADATRWLSPRQLALAARLADLPESERRAIGREPAESLEELTDYARRVDRVLDGRSARPAGAPAAR